MKKILLDTNAYTKYLSGDEGILNMLGRADIIYMSIFVLGELYAGFKSVKKEAWNKDLLDKFLKKPTVEILNATSETSEIFGDVKHSLKISGNSIPINDVWIASHAIETGSILITYDKHFSNVPGLRT
ncbi:type II toxin-antitoxin system VapC family toxin [Candidatus Desantisbacteria bacterium]|nr:type II toxin-antitoxin system VapC family toxin [Candidatus Desantisbacteria bacterium]